MTQTKRNLTTRRATPRKEIPCHCANPADVDQMGQAYAGLIVSPAVSAYRVLNASQPDMRDGLDVPGLLNVLTQQADAVKGGDLAQAESTLINQAVALQSLWSHLAVRALGQSHVENLEPMMRLALKAQSQCRATLETLGSFRSPPAVFARQANVTTGPQQINNGLAQAREIQSPPNQLSGATSELLPDARTSSHASGANPALEAVGIINRP